MKLFQRHIVVFIASFLCLILGTLNYLLFNPHIVLFDWVNLSFQPIPIQNNMIRVFVKGYLSDLLWCSSLCLTAFNLYELKLIKTVGKILLLSVPIIFEFLQYPKIVSGVFDWKDVGLYIILISLFTLFFSIFKPNDYEKV